jgi:ABC-type Fe3+/spermidine/putrescine transport system ATPase subunit/ABC-type sulfate transport system permease component
LRARASSPLPWLAGLLAVYLLAPILAFVIRLGHGAYSPPGVGPALATSLLTATISAALVTVFGVPLAYLLARGRGLMTRLLTVLVALPLALPPLMSGLLLLYIVGPYTLIGRLFDGRLTDTRAGIVLAQTFVSAPFLIIAARAAFATVDPALEDVAATLGHGRWARFRLVAVPAALPGIGAGVMLAWLRSFGEFGATVILAYHPYSLPVFTFVQFDATGLSATVVPIAASLAAALVVLSLVQLRAPRRRRLQSPPAHMAPRAPDAPGARPPMSLEFALSKCLGSGFSLDLAHRARSPRLALLGPSGAGKTLTLRLLSGLASMEPRGYVRAGARRIDRLPTERRGIGYVPQQPSLIPRRTVWRQVIFGAKARPGLAAWWIERLGLAGLEDRYPDELSGGQQRRVALARALAIEPAVLLLDEPFTGLDAPVRNRLGRELRRLQHELGLSTLIVTHDPEEAALLADEILVIDDGRMLQAGTRESVFHAPLSPHVASLLGIVNAHHGRIAAPGCVASNGAGIQARTGELAEGREVIWCIRPERISLCPDGEYSAVVLDCIDLGAVRELTISLDGTLELTVRTSDSHQPRNGEALSVDLAPEDISIWPSPDGVSAGLVAH